MLWINDTIAVISNYSNVTYMQFFCSSPSECCVLLSWKAKLKDLNWHLYFCISWHQENGWGSDEYRRCHQMFHSEWVFPSLFDLENGILMLIKDTISVCQFLRECVIDTYELGSDNFFRVWYFLVSDTCNVQLNTYQNLM